MGQSTSIPNEYARLLFTNNSLRNNVIQCDALGIYYQLSTPTEAVKNKRLTTFFRWDSRQGKDVVIAEWERRFFGKDRIRMPSMGRQLVEDGTLSENRFVLVNEFLRRTAGIHGIVYANRTFTTSNGRRYVWKSRDMSMKLYEEGSDVPIASYYERSLFKKANPHIKIAPNCEEILDYIIVTCVIAERKRRDTRKRQRSGGGGPGGDGGGGGGD